MSPPTRAPRQRSRLRLFWARVRAEGIPQLSLFFVLAVIVAGVSLYRIELGRNDLFKSPEDGLWWAMVTLTTTGYGDKYPITLGGRLAASVAMIVGMVVAGIITARIAAVIVVRKMKEGRGLRDAHSLTGHLVILGWKADLPQLIEEILHIDPQLSTDRLVLLNLADDLQIEDLRSRFPGIVYVRGDIIDGDALERANLAKASKAIILADASNARGDAEIDARTVLANMAVKSLAPEVYTCAEVLDRKHAAHLQLARCDEVILSREYSRALLAGAAIAAGVTHVLHDLLDFADMKGLLTEPIPPRFVGGSFGALAAHLKQEGQLLIGLLQNTGQSLQIKRQALREAQKTIDSATLVQNLRRVKGLRANLPLITPPDDHVVAPHSLAIVIGRPRGQGAVA